MKKIVAMLLVCAMVLTLCACGTADQEEREAIGYVIVPHSDGDEHAPIYSYYYSYGTMVVCTMDGRKIMGSELIVIVENN
jgi:hypothetical protein